jgi:hypothetical protein
MSQADKSQKNLREGVQPFVEQNPESSHSAAVWLSGWRKVLGVAALCFILSLISMAPFILLSGDTSTPSDPLAIKNSLLIIAASLGSGAVLTCLAILMALWGVWRRQARWAQLLRPASGLLFALGVGSLLGLVLTGPALGRSSLFANIFYNIVGSECSVQVVVVAYADQNQNGLRDITEPGLAHVPITVTMVSELRLGNASELRSWKSETDNLGLAEVKVYAFTCTYPRNRLPQLEVLVGSVADYQVSTPQSMEPFPATAYPGEPPRRVFYLGFVQQ